MPAGALRIIQPGEVHASRDFAEASGASPRLLYVSAGVLGEIAVGAEGRAGAPPEPFFPSPVVLDRELARSHLELCLALGERPASRLEQESLLFSTLGRFVARHAAGRFAVRAAGREPWAVAEVKAYLDAHFAENVSLRGLANLVGLTPPYLDRAFARAVGLSPHRYQVQRRVERAKALLAAGMPIGAVASETGFADQSHLGRHFKRLVGVSPGRYLARPAPRLGEGTTR